MRIGLFLIVLLCVIATVFYCDQPAPDSGLSVGYPDEPVHPAHSDLITPPVGHTGIRVGSTDSATVKFFGRVVSDRTGQPVLGVRICGVDRGRIVGSVDGLLTDVRGKGGSHQDLEGFVLASGGVLGSYDFANGGRYELDFFGTSPQCEEGIIIAAQAPGFVPSLIHIVDEVPKEIRLTEEVTLFPFDVRILTESGSIPDMVQVWVDPTGQEVRGGYGRQTQKVQNGVAHCEFVIPAGGTISGILWLQATEYGTQRAAHTVVLREGANGTAQIVLKSPNLMNLWIRRSEEREPLIAELVVRGGGEYFGTVFHSDSNGNVVVALNFIDKKSETVRFDSEGCVSKILTTEELLSLPIGEAGRRTILMSRGGGLSGTVALDDGAAVSRKCVVRLLSAPDGCAETGTQNARTILLDPGGRFHAEGLREGRMLVWVEKRVGEISVPIVLPVEVTIENGLDAHIDVVVSQDTVPLGGKLSWAGLGDHPMQHALLCLELYSIHTAEDGPYAAIPGPRALIARFRASVGKDWSAELPRDLAEVEGGLLLRVGFSWDDMIERRLVLTGNQPKLVHVFPRKTFQEFLCPPIRKENDLGDEYIEARANVPDLIAQ